MNEKGYGKIGNIIYELNNGNGCYGKLEYEGEYLIGKGKEYNYDDDKLQFERKYLSGGKNIKGKENHKNINEI